MSQNPRNVHAASDSQLHSSGLCLGNFVVSSDLPLRSWNAISDLESRMDSVDGQLPMPFSLKHEVYGQQADGATIVAFVTEPKFNLDDLQKHREAVLVSPSLPSLEELNPVFEFLYSKKIRSFYINKAAVDLFISHKDQLLELKTKIEKSPSLIITGHSLGGAIASLFTLWLFDSMDLSKSKRPLCITFGSPLVGDKTLQKAILQYTALKSCFLHMVYHLDPVPRLLFENTQMASGANAYQPFGTFLICSESGCSSFEDPDSIRELMVATGKLLGDSDQGLQTIAYGDIARNLKRKAICKNNARWGGSTTDPLHAWIITQLQAIGLLEIMQQQESSKDSDALMKKIKLLEEKFRLNRKAFDPSKKLNEIKIEMAKLEWYKKVCKNEGAGYYDCYRKGRQTRDSHATECKKKLTNYWKDEVKDADSRPQKEGAHLRTRWLLGGTTYRRMVEPLEIADHYKNGGRDYCNQGRHEHFIKLENWLSQSKKTENDASNKKHQDVASILTEDSCFWAYVEEARISCKALANPEINETDKDSERKKLIDFENYVLGLIKNRKASSEIFLEDSSFMHWWKDYDYKAIMEASYTSPFVEFMKILDTKSKVENESYCILYEKGGV